MPGVIPFAGGLPESVAPLRARAGVTFLAVEPGSDVTRARAEAIPAPSVSTDPRAVGGDADTALAVDAELAALPSPRAAAEVEPVEWDEPELAP